MKRQKSAGEHAFVRRMRIEAALVLAIAAAGAIILAQLDFFEHFVAFGIRHEYLEIDELVPAIILLGAALMWIAARSSWMLRHALAEGMASQQQALLLARMDPLTGLCNRRALAEFVADRLEAGGDRHFTVLLGDLDRFKEVNDLHGHRAGDIVLREIAARFRAIQADFDDVLIVRLGGDEFAFAIGHEAGSDIAADLSARIMQAAAAPIIIDDGRNIRLSASIGRARLTAGMSVDAVLSEADAAMYEAKRQRREGNDPAADDPLSRWGRRLLEGAAPSGAQAGRPLFTAVLGVDRFAAMRGTVGHAFSGRLMRQLGERLTASSAGISIERIAPDAFGIAFQAANDVEAAELVHELRRTAEGPMMLGEQHLVDVTVTVGYAGPGGLDGLRALTEQAQIALDQARASHRKQAIFSKADYGDPSDRLSLMREMREALGSGQISLAYQPKLRARDNSIDSVEALIRWRHPERGMIAPDHFVAIAEETGDIREMTEWVLRRAIEDQAYLAREGLDLTVYVNLSGRLVGDTGFIARMLGLIHGAGGKIGIEITETAVIDDPQNALTNLRLLSDAGIKLSIDDYGTGMSSLVYLKQLPVQELKIDRQFIRDISSSHRDPMIVRSTIDLAHGLGMEVTAEGVETMSSLALLRVMGCDLIQGFLIARPMPIDGLLAFWRGGGWIAEQAPDLSAFAGEATFWTPRVIAGSGGPAAG